MEGAFVNSNAYQNQASYMKKSSGPEWVNSGEDFSKAESMCQSRGENTLVNIDKKF